MATDLMLFFETDPQSLTILRTNAETLGCDHVAVSSLESLQLILTTRRPALVVLAFDQPDISGADILHALAERRVSPVIFLVGTFNDRVLNSVKRTALTYGLTVAGTFGRPLDPGELERVITPHLSTPPPIPRTELETALLRNELTLHYLPKVALLPIGLQVVGVEALVRWEHPRRGMLHPRHFLHIFEQQELLSGLTDFVMTEALRQAGLWRARDLTLEMVINLSPRLVRDRGFPDRLACLLRENGVPPEQLLLDVTESASVVDRDLMLDVFTRLRIQGVGLSLDNFGTGLSSLTELYRMPYSEVKVDHSLIADVMHEREAMLVVRAIAELSHTLQLSVCAEGVENRQTLEFVRGCGFNTAQGRLFSKAVPAGEVEQIVRSWPVFDVGSTGHWHAASTSGAAAGAAGKHRTSRG